MPTQYFTEDCTTISALMVDLIHLNHNFRNCTFNISDNTVFVTVNLLYNPDVAAVVNYSADDDEILLPDLWAADLLLAHRAALSRPMQHLTSCLKYNTERFATIKNYPLLPIGGALSTRAMLKYIADQAACLLPEYRIKTLGCMVAVSPYYYRLND